MGAGSKSVLLIIAVAMAIPFAIACCLILMTIAGIDEMTQTEPPYIQTQAYEWVLGVPQNSDADFQYTDPGYAGDNIVTGAGVAQPGQISVLYDNIPWDDYEDEAAGSIGGIPIAEYGASGTKVPVGCVFGLNPNYTMLGAGVPHNGVDWPVAAEGQKVVAVMGGKVVFAGLNDGWGHLVVVENGDYQTWYAHLLVIYVSNGQVVQQGSLLALSGGKTPPAGNSTGSHLHLGLMVRTGGTYFWIDPLPYMDSSQYVRIGC